MNFPIKDAATIGISLMGVAVAMLVYRLNADKLFVDYTERRRAAIDDLFAAANSFQAAIRAAKPPLNFDDIDGDEMKNLWRAFEKARHLFGPEVTERLRRYEDALQEYSVKQLDLSDARTAGDDVRPLHREVIAASTAISIIAKDLSKSVGPYIELGRRGLGLRSSVRLLSRDLVLFVRRLPPWRR